MRKIHYTIIILFSFIFMGAIVVYAQNDCDINNSSVIQTVSDVCSGIGDNQVCYGNYEVGADLYDNVEIPDFRFKAPGDLADLENIQSIYLSALNPDNNTWGIAQMLLLTATNKGTQELNLLLFGDVQVKNAVEPTLIVEVKVGRYAANIRNLPTVNSYPLQSAPAGTLLEAVGRLEDSSWVRVKTDNGAVGWILTELVKPISQNDSIDELEVQDDTSPYFGPMQAMYFHQGSSSACANVTSNGLIIQTPQGPASVNLSINGVNIELIPGNTGSTAYVQGSDSDMTITMLGGTSNVSANGQNYYMGPGQQSTTQIGADGTASGQPTFPTTYDSETINNLPNLPFVTPVSPISTDSTNIEISDTATNPIIDPITGLPIDSSTGTGAATSGTANSCEIHSNSIKACGRTGDLNSSTNNSGGNGGGNGGGNSNGGGNNKGG